MHSLLLLFLWASHQHKDSCATWWLITKSHFTHWEKKKHIKCVNIISFVAAVFTSSEHFREPLYHCNSCTVACKGELKINITEATCCFTWPLKKNFFFASAHIQQPVLENKCKEIRKITIKNTPKIANGEINFKS